MFNVKHLNLYICLPPPPKKQQQQQQNPKNKQTGKIQSKQRQPALQRLRCRLQNCTKQHIPTIITLLTFPLQMWLNSLENKWQYQRNININHWERTVSLCSDADVLSSFLQSFYPCYFYRTCILKLRLFVYNIYSWNTPNSEHLMHCKCFHSDEMAQCVS